MVYLIKGPKFEHKKHLNQIKKEQHSKVEENNRPEEEPMDIMFDTFDMTAPQTEVRRQSKRKRRATKIMEVNPKIKKIMTYKE